LRVERYVKTMTTTYKNFIDGEWVASSSGKTFPNINPANTEDVLGYFQQSSAEDARRAIEVAVRAQEKWAKVPAPKRGAILYKAAQMVAERVQELGEILTREEGKTIGEGKAEVLRASQILSFFGGEGDRFLGDAVPSPRENVFVFTMRQPLGVVSLITPWNFPIAIPTWKIAPALVSGNAVVFKPASLAPLTSLKLVEILHEAGVPKGVLNYITGPGSTVGNVLITNRTVKGVSFTGSCEVGKGIYQCTQQNMIRTQLEMGGKNPTIVLSDANLEEAVNVTINGAFFSTGQRCTATSRVIVEEPILDRFTRLLLEKTKALKVGNGLDPSVQMGPLVDENQLKTVLNYIDLGKKEGATLLLGGNRLTGKEYDKGYFVEPTIFKDVKPDMRIAQEEIFGPVLAIIPTKNFDEAIEIANNIKFGLSATLCTNDLSKTFQYANRIEAGVVNVNLPSAGVDYHVPFGGMKDSSSGFREQGRVAIDFYTELKTVYVKHTL